MSSTGRPLYERRTSTGAVDIELTERRRSIRAATVPTRGWARILRAENTKDFDDSGGEIGGENGALGAMN